jgi:serine O-acetyltransferase
VPVLPQALDAIIFLLFNCVIRHDTKIGRGTYCAYRGMSVLIHRDTWIGSDVVIGPHVVIGGRSGQHPPQIHDGVYLGANACVLGSVCIGEGATIGAGAVVLEDVPAGARVAGNPARCIDSR